MSVQDCFRHTMRTLLAERKMAAGVIQRMLGHSRVATTEAYFIRTSHKQM